MNAYGATYVSNIRSNSGRSRTTGGLRYGHMTSNLVECINFVLKRTHHLLVTSIVKETYFRLVAMFPKRESTYAREIASDGTFYDKVMKEIRKIIARANIMYVVCHSRQDLDFRVMEQASPDQEMSDASYCVNLNEGNYDCGRFQALQYLCAHAIAAYGHLRIYYAPYINNVY